LLLFFDSQRTPRQIFLRLSLLDRNAGPHVKKLLRPRRQ
jgi:hypothetical protein